MEEKSLVELGATQKHFFGLEENPITLQAHRGSKIIILLTTKTKQFPELFSFTIALSLSQYCRIGIEVAQLATWKWQHISFSNMPATCQATTKPQPSHRAIPSPIGPYKIVYIC